MPGRADRRGHAVMALIGLILPAWLAAASLPPPSKDRDDDIARLFRRIRDEMLGLAKYPGEDFNRGEFHLGPGDDDTNKTHAVGIIVRGEAESFRMTIVVSRLETSERDPRVGYAKDPKTIVCRFPAGQVEIVRSDYPTGELEELLPLVLKAVVDKKNLLGLIKPPGGRLISP